MNLDYATVFSLAPFVNENIVTIIGICLLIGAMAKSVRRCALFWNGEEISKHWPKVFLTTELGIGENPMLNIAFPFDYHHTNSDLNNLPGVGCFNIIKVQLFTTSPLPPIYLGNVTHSSPGGLVPSGPVPWPLRN